MAKRFTAEVREPGRRRRKRALAVLIAFLLVGGATGRADDAYPRDIDAVRESPRSLLFGINMVANPHILHYPEGYNEDVYRTLQRIGGTMVRLCASPREIEQTRGQRDWEELEAEVDLALRSGMEPMMLICNTPVWALPVQQIPDATAILALPEDERSNRLMRYTHQYPYRKDLYPEFADFCRDLATRMKGRIRLYQLWNEPNGYGWHFHDGFNHADEYVPFLAVAYQAVKEADPNALLLMGSLDDKEGHAHFFLNMYYEIRDREYGGRSLCDGITVHPYDNDISNMKHKLKRLRDIMLQNGDGDLPVFITEYGWRTGAGGDYRKAKWLRDTLRMFQDEDLEFLKGAIHLCLSDFEGEPGFGLTDENLRPRESFHVFQGTPRFGVSPPHTIRWRPISANQLEVAWETLLPAETAVRYAKGGLPKDGRGSFATLETPVDVHHRAVLQNLESGAAYELVFETRTAEGGKLYRTPPYLVRVPGQNVFNGDFNEGFRAGIGEGWRIAGEGLSTDAAVFPGIRMATGEHAQVVFAVPEREIPLDSLAWTWAAAEADSWYELSVAAADASFESEARVSFRLGLDAGGGQDPAADTILWSGWEGLEDAWKELRVRARADRSVVTIYLQGRARGEGKGGRPAAAFDRVRIRKVAGANQ